MAAISLAVGGEKVHGRSAAAGQGALDVGQIESVPDDECTHGNDTPHRHHHRPIERGALPRAPIWNAGGRWGPRAEAGVWSVRIFAMNTDSQGLTVRIGLTG